MNPKYGQLIKDILFEQEQMVDSLDKLWLGIKSSMAKFIKKMK